MVSLSTNLHSNHHPTNPPRGVPQRARTGIRHFANTSRRITRIPGSLFGRKRRTKSWPASLASPSGGLRSPRQDLHHEPLRQETRHLVQNPMLMHPAVQGGPSVGVNLQSFGKCFRIRPRGERLDVRLRPLDEIQKVGRFDRRKQLLPGNL